MTIQERAEQFAKSNITIEISLKPETDTYEQFCQQVELLKTKVSDAYLAGYNEAAKWISTLIELPEPGVDVLAEFEFGIAIGRRSGNIILDDQAGYQATYWQPISKR